MGGTAFRSLLGLRLRGSFLGRQDFGLIAEQSFSLF